MKRFLRIAAVILVAVSLCLVLSSCSGTKTDENGLVYTLDKESDTYSVTGYSGSAGEITIPAKYDTRLVTSIGASAFAGNKTLEKITLHEGITTIGANAFNGCTELSEVVFDGESKLTELSVGVFSGCTKLDDVKIPNGVTKIGYKAFNNCTAMKSVSFPAKLEVIDYYAFSGCTSLYDIDFDMTKTFKVKANAFYRCEDLKTLMTPEVDGDKAEYSYSNGMLSEKAEGGLKLIKWLKEGEECAISADVIEIHPQAFTDRDDIKKFTVDTANKNYTSSDDGILYNKDKTKLIAFPNAADYEIVTVAYGVKEIDAFAFCGNVLTKEIRLPDTVEKIGEYAFSESSVETLTVASNKIIVGQNAFSGCEDFLSYKYFKKNAEHFIEKGVLFAEYKNSDDKTGVELICYPLEAEDKTYEVPAFVTAVNSGAFSLNESLEAITVNAENKKFLAKDGILYQGSVDDEKELYETLYAVPRANTLTEYELPETITGIAAYAFYGNKNIVTVKLNEKCKQIPSNMFNGCESLKTLEIPANEIDFGTNSVTGTALSAVTFGGNKVAWERAKNNATDSDKEILDTFEPSFAE